jgi:hypothetical protein
MWSAAQVTFAPAALCPRAPGAGSTTTSLITSTAAEPAELCSCPEPQVDKLMETTSARLILEGVADTRFDDQLRPHVCISALSVRVT